MSTVADENLARITRHVAWDRYVEEIKLLESLTADERTQAQAAIYTLKGLLGDDDWLRAAVINGHPIFYGLINNAPWTRRVLIRMAEAIASLRGCPNFSHVQKDLRKPDKYGEAASVLELAYKFHLTGLQIAFHPTIRISRKDGSPLDKMPDLMVTDPKTGEDFFVEVSALGYNDKQKRNSRVFDVLLRVVMGLRSVYGILLHVQFFDALDDTQLSSAIEEVNQVVMNAKNSGTFQASIIAGLIEVGAAPPEQEQVVREWAIARGINPTQLVQGPMIDLSNELRRLVLDKIGKEVRQLPQDRPGIIIITMDQTLLFYTYPLEIILAALADRLKKTYEQLVCVAITRRHVANETQHEIKLTSTAEFVMIEKLVADPLQETTIVVPHQDCRHSSAPNIMAKVQQAFSGLRE